MYQLTQIGYREGLEKGKLERLQPGFDEGYNSTGAPLGRQVGELCGEADALAHLIASRGNLTEEQTTAQDLLQALRVELANIGLADVAEPDYDALEHDAKHHSGGNVAEMLDQARTVHTERGDRIGALRSQLTQLVNLFLP